MKKISIQESALVIIDMQNDFISGKLIVEGIPGESSFEKIIEMVTVLARKRFQYKAMTKDCHSKNHIECKTITPHCLRHSIGSRFHVGLKGIFRTADDIIEKGYEDSLFSFSVATSFWYPSHLLRLRVLGIKKIFLIGLAYDYCVGESAVDYARQGFEVYVIRDGTRSVALETSNTMDAKLAAYGVKLINFANIE